MELIGWLRTRRETCSAVTGDNLVLDAPFLCLRKKIDATNTVTAMSTGGPSKFA